MCDKASVLFLRVVLNPWPETLVSGSQTFHCEKEIGHFQALACSSVFREWAEPWQRLPVQQPGELLSLGHMATLLRLRRV